MMCAGDTCVALFPPNGDLKTGPSPSASIAMRHFAFVTDRKGFDEARTELGSKGLSPEFADHGICHSIYISDPDGHRIEITTYEI
jgi:catechol-2,3-dioxygenase